MPLDNTIYRVTPSVMETGLAGVRQLSTELKSQLPWNFTWYFGTSYESEGECGSRGCAIGLAHVLWPEQVASAIGPGSIYDHLDLKSPEQRCELLEIFGHKPSNRYPKRSDGGVYWNQVTPQMVAKELDEFCNKYDV